MSKLWDKGKPVHDEVIRFTTGKDPLLDMELSPWDIVGSCAHVEMLLHIGLVAENEAQELLKELHLLYQKAREGELTIDEGVEDIHSQVEWQLTRKLGDTGKKIHTARSRNDQIALDIRLFSRDRLATLRQKVFDLALLFLQKAEQYRDILMPGYTHFQVAMPSSFGLWFGAFAESLADDLAMLNTAYKLVNQNPLGTAAGFGTSLPVDRLFTTQLLGFDNLVINPVYAQVARGKTEKYVAETIASAANTLSLFAHDVVLFLSQNFGFISLPGEFTTGSSIMPHKKNPDVMELVRGIGNRLQAIPYEFSLITNNLPTGYHRDKQLLKESYLSAFTQLEDILGITTRVLENLQVNERILEDEKYKNLFTVEEVNQKVLQGTPFRDAYREVAKNLEQGNPPAKSVPKYTHLGSIGNPGVQEIRKKLKTRFAEVDVTKAVNAVNRLMKTAD